MCQTQGMTTLPLTCATLGHLHAEHHRVRPADRPSRRPRGSQGSAKAEQAQPPPPWWPGSVATQLGSSGACGHCRLLTPGGDSTTAQAWALGHRTAARAVGSLAGGDADWSQLPACQHSTWGSSRLLLLPKPVSCTPAGQVGSLTWLCSPQHLGHGPRPTTGSSHGSCLSCPHLRTRAPWEQPSCLGLWPEAAPQNQEGLQWARRQV